MTGKQIGAEVWDLFKKNLWIIVIGAVALIIFFKGCNGNGQGKNTSDTTTKTTQVLQPIIINPPQVPQQSGNTIFPITIPQSSQGLIPASNLADLTAQVKDLSLRIEALGKDYYATRTYQDSISLKDTAGRRVGVVNLNQLVSENKLKSIQSSYQLLFPHTVTTITNTVYPPARNQVYIGGGAQSQINSSPVTQVDLGLLFKNKNDVAIGIAPTYTFPNKQVVGGFGGRISLYKLISFRKK